MLCSSGIAYQLRGSGAPLVLVHGLGGDHTALAPQLDHFSGRYAVLALDLAGHGASMRPARQPVADPLADVTEVLRDFGAAEGTPSPIVIGHSLGGLIALAAAAAGMARAAVLLDPAPMLTERARSYWASQLDAIRGDADGVWRRRFVGRLFHPDDTVGRESLPETMVATSPEAVAAHAAWMAEFDARAALTQVGVPLLAIGSDAGEDLSAAPGLCPTIEVDRLAGVGHFLQLERPAEVNARIEAFLGALD